ILIHTDTTQILGIAHANTSVEEPDNNVMIGVLSAARELEKQSGIMILGSPSVQGELSFSDQVSYLSTSSAGGGLQILVIGLTLFDSGSSAKRAAYGAGGVILDVFAIDDKRKAVEQMQTMRNLRPDMILLCGGTDGGALSSVLRMAEILRIAKPLPKYQSRDKIPTLYAGNKDAAEMIQNMITRDFDLHILPNLRPGLNEENLKPTQDKIQELFMENVMERAPGYAGIKKVVSNPILPTPSGVLRAMQSLGEDKKNIIAFDIGGATTDVFTRINGHYQRTVSANLGMSYSALNVLKEKGIANLMKMLPPEIDERAARNYIGNKSIYPTVVPVSEVEFRIEHALAKAAIQMAYEQHRQMHYNTRKIGYLDIIKQEGRDKYEEKFHYLENEESYSFYPSDIDVLIGAGGVFAHAQNSGQCIDMMISGFKPMGITKLVIDSHFISPHLGVLSTADPALSKKLLDTQCLQSLALHIRPHFPQKKGTKTLRIKTDGMPEELILSDDIRILEAKKGRKLSIEPARKCLLNGNSEQIELFSDLMIIIDARLDQDAYHNTVDSTLCMYAHSTGKALFMNHNAPQMGSYTQVVNLPYKGEIMVKEADQVTAEDLIAVNQYDPARLFVIPAISNRPGIREDLI
ncbi:MAG TPA: glutamate mutase L, partial [Candidatus Cloacimonadota bacterium]|nr:glutamate mutase L [Candidatus Cloacimonadota bacterium]